MSSLFGKVYIRRRKQNKTKALNLFLQFYLLQHNFSSAVTFAEEAYNLVITAYNPVHVLAQNAANNLISTLILKKDYSNAEQYAEVNYSSLRDHKYTINQESEEVATSAHNLSDVIFQQSGDLVKSEKLAREFLHIISFSHGSDNQIAQPEVAVFLLISCKPRKRMEMR
jgi:hypothetical protein